MYRILAIALFTFLLLAGTASAQTVPTCDPCPDDICANACGCTWCWCFLNCLINGLPSSPAALPAPNFTARVQLLIQMEKNAALREWINSKPQTCKPQNVQTGP